MPSRRIHLHEWPEAVRDCGIDDIEENENKVMEKIRWEIRAWLLSRGFEVHLEALKIQVERRAMPYTC